MADAPNQEYTEDQLKQVEFLLATLQRYDADQGGLYKDLSTKITFLFGFVVAVLTIYGTYATHTNSDAKSVALVLFGFTTLSLCLALKNRKYKRPPMPDITVSNSTYFDKIYKDVAYLSLACTKNKKPLADMSKWVRRSIWAFTIGVVFLVLSFIVSPKFVLHSMHEQHTTARTTRRG